MKIHSSKKSPELNISPELQPLFDAMASGATIKSITCMKGIMNKDNPQHDFRIEDFIATDYYVQFAIKRDSEGSLVHVSSDLVDTDKRDFYMNWVRSFELY